MLEISQREYMHGLKHTIKHTVLGEISKFKHFNFRRQGQIQTTAN